VQLAVEGADLAGFVCAYGAQHPEWGSLIDNLHVARARKRSGIGAALLERAGAWLHAEYPGQPVHLFVLEMNAAARRFYEKLGAENQGVSTMQTQGGLVRSCRYAWPSPAQLARAARPA
jgi:ribosomal protein S18 acetylase RimI-like enzyme